MCCTRLAANAGPKKSRLKSPSGHHPTTLSGYIFATKTCINNRKKLLNGNISPACPYNTVNFVPLAAEIVLLVWGTPANFNRFRVLTALLHGTRVVGVSQSLRRWTEGATYIRQDGHYVGHWPHSSFQTLCSCAMCISSSGQFTREELNILPSKYACVKLLQTFGDTYFLVVTLS